MVAHVFSSIVRRWKWPSLSRNIVEIQKFCYYGNMMSPFSLFSKNLDNRHHLTFFLFLVDCLMSEDKGRNVKSGFTALKMSRQ